MAVDADTFDETDLFGVVQRSGACALLFGRRALVLLGAPVLTADYDFWLHIDDIEIFNRGFVAHGFVADRTSDQARAMGRYRLENGHLLDVLVARVLPTVDGQRVAFDELWERRQERVVSDGVSVYTPSVRDLISTKRFAARAKDAQDIAWLEELHKANVE